MARGTLTGGLGGGIGALAGEGWTVLAGAVVGLARGALTLPATAFAVAVAWTGARFALSGGGSPGRAVEAALAALLSPRSLSIVGGLWLAGVLIWGCLRLAWIAGVGPVLAWRLAGQAGAAPRFRDGMTARFGAVLVVGGFALLADLAGALAVAATFAGALSLVGRVQGAALPAAFVAATAGAAALFLAALLSAVGDVAVARVAMGGEPSGRAIPRALRSAVRRPAALVLAVVAVGLAGTLAGAAVQGALGAAMGAAPAGGRALVLLSQGLASVLAAGLAAAVELWRLAALGVVALGD